MSDILFNEIEANGGIVAIITLNRVKALNALSFSMLSSLYNQLDKWDVNPNVKLILIKSNSDKAFCAGGDIKSLYNSENDDETSNFFETEYLCDSRIKYLKTPYVSFLDGITMGGGAGISIHGLFRVATDKLIFAMPETLIGFFPDIAATYFLCNCPNNIGLYMGLTGTTINVTDAYQLNLVTHVVTSDQLSEIEKQLIDTAFTKNDRQVVQALLDSFHQTPSDSKLAPYCDMINDSFSQSSVEAIIDALKKSNAEFGDQTIKALLSRSPTSLKVTFKHFSESKDKDFDEVIHADLHIANQFLNSHNFLEGIRAAVIDKDKQPQWSPSCLANVSDTMVNAFFQ